MNLIQYQLENRIASITIDRPEKRNALNDELVVALKDALTNAFHDNHAKVIRLKANGLVFSAGADLAYLKKLQSNSYEENLADSNQLRELFELIYFAEKPVIAQVQGHAIAGGCGLANVCDVTFATSEAKFGYTEVKIGFIPAIVMTFLIRKIGESKSKELLLSGRLIDAKEAKQIGLVHYITEDDQLESQAMKYCTDLVENCSAQSLASTKRMINRVQDMNMRDALIYASEMNAKTRASEDCKKGISAFLNKDKMSW